MQDESITILLSAPRSTAVANKGVQPQTKQVIDSTEFKPSCDAASPFGMVNTGCKTSESATASEATSNTGAEAGSSSSPQIPSFPDFANVEVVGSLGAGVAASALKADGRNLAATRDNSDSVLIDAVSLSNTAALAAVKEALNRDKQIILDGSMSVESSNKIYQIMSDMKFARMLGVTSYAISKLPDGTHYIVPLHSTPNEKGVSSINQLNNVLRIKVN